MMYAWWSWWIHRPDWFWFVYLGVLLLLVLGGMRLGRRKP